MSRILILGAYGFIGSALYRDLSLAGHEIVAFGRNKKIAELCFSSASFSKWS